MIYESALITATNNDVLSAGRLNTIPYSGMLTLHFLSDLADVANFFVLTIQVPNSRNPIDAQLVPGANPSLPGVLDDRQLLAFQFQAEVGGHFVVALTETGVAACTFRAILTP